MQSGGTLVDLLSPIFGVGVGAGMAVQITIFATCGMLIALGGFGIRQLRSVEEFLPDGRHLRGISIAEHPRGWSPSPPS